MKEEMYLKMYFAEESESENFSNALLRKGLNETNVK